MIAYRFAATLLVALFLFGGTNSAKKPEWMTATLVEVHEWPQCVGLDCPPWSVPPFAVVCLQAGDTFYVAEYRPPALPWATQGKKLMALLGSSLEIVLKREKILVCRTPTPTDSEQDPQLRAIQNTCLPGSLRVSTAGVIELLSHKDHA